MTTAREYVETLANALDNDDYETGLATLSPDVVYDIGDERLTGAAAILASYRSASESAHRMFDEVGYDSTVFDTDEPGTFRISYLDILTANGETHTHHAEQILTASDEMGITHILNVEVPGERAKVDEFMARHGITRE